MKYAINYCKENFLWDETFSNYSYSSAKDFIKTKKGNSASINLFLLGMLKSLNIESYPVILSTRKHGKINIQYPYDDSFNNVVVLIKNGEKTSLVDATEPMLPNNKIPNQDINGEGLLVKEKTEGWINLTLNNPSLTRTIIISKVDEDSIISTLNISYTDYEAFDYRKDFDSKIEKIKKRYNIIDTIGIANRNNPERPLILNFKTEYSTEKANNKIYISPFIKEAILENPFKQKERTYPIDFIYPFKKTLSSTIYIPDNYEIESFPKEYNINNDKFSLKHISQVADKTITISCEYCFKQSVYQPEDYNNVKFYFNEIVNKTNEKVILKKKQ